MADFGDLCTRLTVTVLVTIVSSAMTGCSSEPATPPELTQALAGALIAERWSQEEMNHYRVVFHSDTLVECGVKNDLWRLTQVTDREGNAWTSTYQLTERGRQILTSIDLKESGRGH